MSMSKFKVGPALAVSDMERAKEFYEGPLGLELGEDMGEARVYPCGGETGLFVYLSPDHAGKSTATLVGWEVDDVEQVVAQLSEKGVTFEQYDEESLKTDERGIVDAGEMKVAFFKDPDGNTHSINGS